jgi:NAD(P)-dependent dehydrogenase (short-subunit alcohol dehydrogenase family)
MDKGSKEFLMTDIFQKYQMKGQVALVTGGAGMLGSEFCRTLAEAEAKVVIADINAASAVDNANRLNDKGYSAMGVGVDVTRPESVEAMIAATLQTYGRLDVLVNCAALDPKFDRQHLSEQDANAFESYPLEAWNQALAVDLTGLFLCSQAAVKPMLAQNYGVMVNICSTYGLVGPDQRIYQRPGKSPSYKPVSYSVTKSGVLGLTRYLATYYAGRNIRVNALTPGGVYNDHDDIFVQSYSAHTVMGRMAERDEMNGALLFLASDASSYMTGANLVVDGGWTAW